MQLPGEYGPPRGRLWLGLTESLVAGMVALRPLPGAPELAPPDDRPGQANMAAEAAAEIKRLYVRPAARRQGVGRALVTALIAEARRIGYARLYLETLEAMHEAHALYRSLGFAEVARPHPTEREDDRTIRMMLTL